ncbi:unnamed protein product [Fraxinus pennsylvanica]|uniref:Frataxin n=1 Tax=Fraxinus pennsylvanica TaxID=56036 RepID=A0AAD1ZHN7_9LAMI|nr:unnamed protein product [Fraxinus pennsylvanica]
MARLGQLTRTVFRSLKHQSSFPFQLQSRRSSFYFLNTCFTKPLNYSPNSRISFTSRGYSSVTEESQSPSTIDYRSVLPEEKYHMLANSTIHDLIEKLEEYGDSLEIDGFDVDYGNEVLTLKLGSLGTYVINKQTPNRQIWMSSPLRY